MKKTNYDDYTVISEITLFNKFGDVVNLCDSGINVLHVNTDRVTSTYTLVITKHDDIMLHAFVGFCKYQLTGKISFNDDTLLCNVIEEILDIIGENLDKVEMYI